jgi:hypothetical protein
VSLTGQEAVNGYVLNEVEQIAIECLVPNQEVLVEESRRILAQVPQADPPDRSQWRPRFYESSEKWKLQKAALKQLADGPLKGKTYSLHWHPLRLTRSFRMSVFAKLENPNSFRRRAMIEAVAFYGLEAAADANPEHPLIVTRTGNEMTLIRLQRNAAGSYDLASFEWLVGADGPNQRSAEPTAEGEKTAWGPAVEGVQCRLRAEKPTWPQGTVPKLFADLRNPGKRNLRVAVESESWEIEIDGKWQKTDKGFEGDRNYLPLAPGGQQQDLKVWIHADDNLGRKLRALQPGKHTLRAARLLNSSRSPGEDVLRVVSNPIEIEITAPPPDAAQDRPQDAVRGRVVDHDGKPVAGALGEREAPRWSVERG